MNKGNISFEVYKVEAETETAIKYWLSKNKENGALSLCEWFPKRLINVSNNVLTCPYWLYEKKYLHLKSISSKMEIVE